MMKNIFLITTLLIATIGMNSCKDKTPEPVADINNLLGAWVSKDSMVGQMPDGTFSYLKDTIHFLLNHEIFGHSIEKCLLTERGVFEFDYYTIDSLFIELWLFRNSGILTIPDIKAHLSVNFSTNKDTIQIVALSDVYPYTRFNEFYRL